MRGNVLQRWWGLASFLWSVLGLNRLKIRRLGNKWKICRHTDIFEVTLGGIFSQRFARRGRWCFSLGLAMGAEGAVDEVLDICALRSVLQHEVALAHQILSLLPLPITVLLSQSAVRFLVFYRHLSPSLAQDRADFDELQIRVLFLNSGPIKFIEPCFIGYNFLRHNLKLLPKLNLLHGLLAPLALFGSWLNRLVLLITSLKVRLLCSDFLAQKVL